MNNYIKIKARELYDQIYKDFYININTISYITNSKCNNDDCSRIVLTNGSELFLQDSIQFIYLKINECSNSNMTVLG